MGSEILVVAYSVLAFLCLCLYFLLDWQNKGGAGKGESSRGSETEGFLPRGKSIVDSEFNPIIFGFKLLAVAFFFISLVGLGDAVMESYDYCSILPVNVTTINETAQTLDYARTCFDNANTEGLSFYKLVFLFAELAGFLFLLAMILQLYFFIRDKIWARIRSLFRRRT